MVFNFGVGVKYFLNSLFVVLFALQIPPSSGLTGRSDLGKRERTLVLVVFVNHEPVENSEDEENAIEYGVGGMKQTEGAEARRRRIPWADSTVEWKDRAAWTAECTDMRISTRSNASRPT